MSTPDSPAFFSSVRRISATPPPNNVRKTSRKLRLIASNVSWNFARDTVSISAIVFSVAAMESSRSFCCVSRNSSLSLASLYSSSAKTLTAPRLSNLPLSCRCSLSAAASCSGVSSLGLFGKHLG